MLLGGRPVGVHQLAGQHVDHQVHLRAVHQVQSGWGHSQGLQIRDGGMPVDLCGGPDLPGRLYLEGVREAFAQIVLGH
ncbi:hypothetical protein [Deinococcus humi]|uniref:Uncharacterized protein n=1 Tax=Deinococcus humi TaxID=662880 RepID=A0A7W8JUJ5_9DEIO|nr:hypothetical protein [Deinococcus humi]MBB5363532.1 hypothetical protein [Deinococcus humi]